MNLTTASPREIDTRIAALHGEIISNDAKLGYATDRVFDWAGRRTWVRATRWGGKSRYEITGTYEEAEEIAIERFAAKEAWHASGANQDLRPVWYGPGMNFPYNKPDFDAHLENVKTLRAKRYALWTEVGALEAEYRRRGGWSRYFLVTSSAGHIHSSAGGCKTCRPTTEYGWMPERSGMTEAEALADLGPHAEALCTVCFPSAPVAGKTKITAAKAAKLSAGTVARQ